MNLSSGKKLILNVKSRVRRPREFWVDEVVVKKVYHKL